MLKGKALLAPCLIIAVWVLVRSGSYPEPELGVPALKAVEADPAAALSDTALVGEPEPEAVGKNIKAPVAVRVVSAQSKYRNYNARIQARVFLEAPKIEPRLLIARKNPPRERGRAHKPTISKVKNANEASDAASNEERQPAMKKNSAAKAPRLALHGYAYWRDADSFGLAPVAQYGGSQAGLIATYRLGEKNTAPAILARVSSDIDSFRNSELALGLRWRPFEKIPLSLTAEQRFRNGSPDAFAAYFAGGYEAKRLPFKTRLLVYGQAGFVVAGKGKRKRNYFYDGNASIERQIVSRGKAKLSIGAGAWAGGQRGVNRVDVGPTAAIDFGFAQTDFRLSADYRFRATGNASPKSGPAVTLSASY